MTTLGVLLLSVLWGHAIGTLAGAADTPPPFCQVVEAERTRVAQGEKVLVWIRLDESAFRIHRSDPQEAVVTWAAPEGRLAPNGLKATFDSSGLAPGDYTVTATVDDGRGHVVECSTVLTVEAPPQ